jgi:hypothetical protein
MFNFKISDNDRSQPVAIVVDNIAGTVGIEAFWEKPMGGPYDSAPYANFKREDAIRLAHAILSAAMEIEP